MPHILKTLTWYGSRALGGLFARLAKEDQLSLARLATRDRGARCSLGLYEFARLYAREYDSIPNEIARNGEEWLLRTTAPHDFRVMLDVGANRGNWAKPALRHHPRAVVHCFEIMPSTFRRLSEALKESADRVRLNDVGLADVAGEIEVFASDESDLLTSVIPPDAADGMHRAPAKARVMRGDDYLRAQGIERVDVLKIDVEGAESLVLKGFADAFRRRAIRLVQFEYNKSAILSGFLLRNFYEWFTGHGYRVGRLFPDGVLFRDYRLEDEDFNGPNYVACLEGETDLIATLSLQRPR